MTRRKLSPQDLQEIRELASRWGKIVARHAFGESGPGTDIDLDAMEPSAPCWRSKPSCSVWNSPVPVADDSVASSAPTDL